MAVRTNLTYSFHFTAHHKETPSLASNATRL